MLTISRPGISSTEITEYSIKERFIKVPIAKFIELWAEGKEDETNDPQRALINAINSPQYRFICAALSRRLGKTFMANMIGHLVCLVPNCNVLIMSPNYSLSSISFELQRNFIKRFGIEVEKDNLKDKVIELSNGSTVRMGSVSQVDSSVGRSYDLIIFDEAALSSAGKDAFNVALRPTLDKPNAKAIFISTPRGKKNWFSEFFQRGFSAEYPNWISIHADYHENKRMTEADVLEAKASMSLDEFEQEYMASFTSFEGAVYKLDPLCVIDSLPLDSLEKFAGLDPGYKDPTAFCVIGYNRFDSCFYVLDEYQESSVTTSSHALEMQKLISLHGIEITFIDSAAAQFAADLAYIYDIPTNKAIKDILPGISFVQNLISNNRLKVMSHCTHTLDMLAQFQWDTKETLTKEKTIHNEYSHMADALRYALYTYRT